MTVVSEVSLDGLVNEIRLTSKSVCGSRQSGLPQQAGVWASSSSGQTVTLGMCAILHDKYQWLAPGFRLWLTGSDCLSWFTQMETILSQHSHKNQSEPFFFPPPFSLHCVQTLSELLRCERLGHGTFICLQDLCEVWLFAGICSFTGTPVSAHTRQKVFIPCDAGHVVLMWHGQHSLVFWWVRWWWFCPLSVSCWPELSWGRMKTFTCVSLTCQCRLQRCLLLLQQDVKHCDVIWKIVMSLFGDIYNI